MEKMTDKKLKAPFPYFGGKSKVADKIWTALGDPKHYIEPFFGSGAVLLKRPNYSQQTETVCDKNGFVANVWRSIKLSPEETAKWCDWPVNHADLIARKRALFKNESKLLEKLCSDDLWHDPVMAGYWIWGASCSIGTDMNRAGTSIPKIGGGGRGVHAGHLGSVNARLDALSSRLRRVRVVCGDWSRVCGGKWQDCMGPCGIFFDPPYGDPDRSSVYKDDSFTVSHDVEKWCLERGNNPRYKIVVAGYNTEYTALVAAGWRSEGWSAQGGYSNTGKNSRGSKNKHRETLFYSPHCEG